jgi:hypothetical protein
LIIWNLPKDDTEGGHDDIEVVNCVRHARFSGRMIR